MKLRCVLLFILAIGSAPSAFSQVEKLAMRTTGISCGVCAAMSEIYLRQLGGIDTIKISLSNEAIMISYKPGAPFQPKSIREALGKTDVGIVQFQVSARGYMQDRGGKKFFVAGKDTFLLTDVPNGTAMAANAPVLIEGVLNDKAQPMEIKILSARPVNK